MKIRRYTTEKTVNQTAQDIQKVLVENGAQKIMFNYENGIATGVLFTINTPQGSRGINLPIEWKKMRKILVENVTIPRNKDVDDYARRVAWRQVYGWVDAQMALIQTEMVELQQVFLPYMVQRDGRTLYENIQDQGYQLPEST